MRKKETQETIESRESTDEASRTQEMRQADILKKRAAYQIADRQLKLTGAVFVSGISFLTFLVLSPAALLQAMYEDCRGSEATMTFTCNSDSKMWGNALMLFVSAIALGLVTLYQADKCWRYYQENNLFPLPKTAQDKGLVAMLEYRLLDRTV